MTKVRKILTEDRGIAKHLFREFSAMITQLEEVIEEFEITLSDIPTAYKNELYPLAKDLRRSVVQIDKTCNKIVEIVAKAQ